MAIPPGPRAPATVQSVQFLRDPEGFLTRCHRRYGDVFAVRLLGGEQAVYVTEPGLIREAFATDRGDGLAGAARARVLEPLVGTRSLLTLDGPAWERQRKLLGPAFHGENIERYADEIRQIAIAEIASWPGSGELELRPRMQAITLEVILRVIFGVREGERLERLRELLPRLIEAAGQMMWAPPWFHRLLERAVRRGGLVGRLADARGFFALRDKVDALIQEEVSARRADPELEERSDVLSWLVRAQDERGEGLSDAELRDELVGLLEAGHETTATALAWAFERLLRTPRALEALTEELERGDRDGYLQAVVRETLRTRPVLFDVARVMERPVEIGGYEVPAGWYLAPGIVNVQRREAEWPEPEEFRPERFLEDDPPYHAWIPFGGGRRRCVGAQLAQLEMMVVIPEVLRHRRLRAPSPDPEATKLRHITLVPSRGGRVVIDGVAEASREHGARQPAGAR
ncbi:MAG: cytochrome P450 [Solirubrobacterales bacterium]